MELIEKYIVLQLELKDEYQTMEPSLDNLKDLSDSLDKVCDLYSIDLKMRSLENTDSTEYKELKTEYDALKDEIKAKCGSDFFDKFDAVDELDLAEKENNDNEKDDDIDDNIDLDYRDFEQYKG